MKKQIKILTTVIMIIAVIATLGNAVLGTTAISETLAELKDPGKVSGVEGVQNFGKQIVGIMQVIGVVVAVVVLLVLGIKYMMGSAEEKAEYKKVMIPYLVGALLIFAATTIVNVVVNIFTNINMVS